MLFVGQRRGSAVDVQLDTIQSRPDAATNYQWPSRAAAWRVFYSRRRRLCASRQTDAQSTTADALLRLLPADVVRCQYIHTPLTNWTPLWTPLVGHDRLHSYRRQNSKIYGHRYLPRGLRLGLSLFARSLPRPFVPTSVTMIKHRVRLSWSWPDC